MFLFVLSEVYTLAYSPFFFIRSSCVPRSDISPFTKSIISSESTKNIKMVEAARAEAGKMVAQDPELRNHSELKKIIEKTAESAHFE